LIGTETRAAKHTSRNNYGKAAWFPKRGDVGRKHVLSIKAWEKSGPTRDGPPSELAHGTWRTRAGLQPTGLPLAAR
jgi:hypothetical protein